MSTSRSSAFATLVTVLSPALFSALGSCSPRQDGADHTDHAGHDAPAASLRDGAEPATPPGGGQAAVELAPELVQRFGVRTERAARAPFEREIRATGIVRTDETRESHVHVKWTGWIEEFFVAYVGQEVEEGDPLFSVYSPDLVAAQQELALAARRRAALADSGRAQEIESATQLLDAARTKLGLWDVPDALIEEVERTGRPRRLVTVHAPRTGTVIARQAVPGLYIEPMTDLYTIADLSRLWLMADLYEGEADRVRPGDVGLFEPVGVGAGTSSIEARVVFVHPTVDPATRTIKARLELDNPDGRLRPGMFGTVRLRSPTEVVLSVPADAVIDTGTRQLVFVRVAAGRFEPREVRVGARAGGRIHVREGLEEGEEVVVRGQFMLDSESQLRARPEGAAVDHGGH